MSVSQSAVNVCFHGIGQPRRPLENGEDRYWVADDQFCRLLDEVSTWPDVSLSFDDGNVSDLEIAVPALQERGLRAAFFVLAARLDAPGSLSRTDLAELTAKGMTIGTHGMDHVPWRRLADADARRELIEARATIEAAVGAPVTQAACPLGRYDRRLLANLRRLGYQHVFTSDRRAARPGAWLQPRFSVTRQDDATTVRETILRPASWHRRMRGQTVGLIKRLR